MSEPLIFMMGKYRAEVPTDRRYAKNHMWALEVDGLLRFGLSAYAVRLLQDVYFLDWTVESGTNVREQEEIGAIESSKAEASLYSPMSGELVELNGRLLRDPSAINVDKYGDGWLLAMRGDGRRLLDAEAYVEHLEAAWQVTQRTIKGQLNE